MMTDEVETQTTEAPEEEKIPVQYFFIEIGKSTAQVETTQQNPSLKMVLAEAMGISERLVFLDEVWLAQDTDTWYRPRLGIGFHVGANSKGNLIAFVRFTRY